MDILPTEKNNKISEWLIQYERYKDSLQMYLEIQERTPGKIKVKELASTFTVEIQYTKNKYKFGVVYDRFMNPEFKSWVL